MSKPKAPRFVLQPCKIREDRIVPVGDVVVWGLAELRKALAMTPNDMRKLRAAPNSTYVGMCVGSVTGNVVQFSVYNPDHTNGIGWVIKKDPDFPTRVLSIYQLEEMDWGATVQEFATPAPKGASATKEAWA